MDKNVLKKYHRGMQNRFKVCSTFEVLVGYRPQEYCDVPGIGKIMQASYAVMVSVEYF